MATIYVTVSTMGEEEKFIGSDGKLYDCLWTIERKISGNMQLSGAMINGQPKYIDFTVPTEVDKLPKGAKAVPNEEAERLWKSDTHYFGE